jgi:hypothetical protein
VIPIVQFVALILCWSGTTTTNSIPMILSGLQYENDTTTPSQSSSSSSSSSQPILFYVALAHRRWLTHHIWENVRTIILPSMTAIQHMYGRQLSNRPPHRRPGLLLQPIQQWLLHCRNNIQTAVTTVWIPLRSPPIQSTYQKHCSVPSHNHNVPHSICPFCEQIPPTIAVRSQCHNCGRTQMYCYSCFYQNYCLNGREELCRRVDEDPTMEQSETTFTANDVNEVGSILYRIPIQHPPRNALHCFQCSTMMDTVSFVHSQ